MSAATDAPRERYGPLDVLRVPGFAWFLSGTALANAAQWIQQVTLSWLVYDVTSSGALLGTLNLVRSLATLGLAPAAGVAIDRLPRRRLLLLSFAWLCGISLIFGLILLIGPGLVWPLFLFSLLSGVGQAVSIPLLTAVVFSLVPKSKASVAVALVQTGWAVMRTVGPTIGGVLILAFGPPGNFFVQAGAYALVVLAMSRLRLPQGAPAAAEEPGRGGFREGLRYVIAKPATRAFVLMQWVLPLLIIPNFDALPPIYVKDVFAGGPDTLGVLLSAIGIGGVVGGIVSASLERVDRRGVLQQGGFFFLSLSLIGFALSRTLVLAIGFMALAGFFEMIFLTANQTLVQLSIPDALRGRVTSILSLGSGLAMPVGSFIAGVGADLVGPRVMTLGMAGLAALIAVGAFVGAPVIREYRLSRALMAAEW